MRRPTVYSASQAEWKADRNGGPPFAVRACAEALIAAGMLSACTIEMLTPTVPPTLAATPTPDLPLSSLLPTIVEVPTEMPTAAPTETPDTMKPAEAGERIFHDPLDGNLSDWSLPKTDFGSVGFSSGMLVFTLNAPNTSLVSVMPREIPSDAYIDITVQTLLCGEGLDTFGLIFRNGKEYHYRYAVTCIGKMRFERVAGSIVKGASVWTETLGLLKGAPATNRIGVLVQKNIFRFFVGGVEVFTGHDPMSSSGGVGLFIQTEKSKVLSVGFTDLAVYTINES